MIWGMVYKDIGDWGGGIYRCEEHFNAVGECIDKKIEGVEGREFKSDSFIICQHGDDVQSHIKLLRFSSGNFIVWSSPVKLIVQSIETSLSSHIVDM